MTINFQSKAHSLSKREPERQFEFIAEMTSELRHMALAMDSDALAHILEVAMLEARMQQDIAAKHGLST